MLNNLCYMTSVLHETQQIWQWITDKIAGGVSGILLDVQDVAHDSYNGLVLDNSEGDHLAEVMQQKRVLLHQNHGVIICAESVAVCFDMLYYLERVCAGQAADTLHSKRAVSMSELRVHHVQAAKIQVLGMSTGKKLNIVSDKASALLLSNGSLLRTRCNPRLTAANPRMQVCAQFKECFVDSGVSAEYARLHLEALKRDMLASQEDKNFIT